MRSWLPFIICALFAATAYCSSAFALTLGMIVSLGFQLTLPGFLKKYGKYVMQLAIVILGFAMDPHVVLKSGSTGVVVTFVTLMVSMIGGWILARLLDVQGTTGVLISAGTGICGGSAIASLSPVIKSKHDEIAIAMATVFCLNAVALFLFPVLGRMFHLSPEQFGWFAAIAIHDTSSVVGAAAEFHPDSVPIAVTAKLTRALWIIPMIVIAALVMRRKAKNSPEESGKITIPWFIGVFVLANILHGLLPEMPRLFQGAEQLGKALLKVAIFIIGAQVTRTAIKAVGPRAMMMAIILWVLMSSLTLFWLLNFPLI